MKKNNYEIVLLTKTNLNSVEVLISKALINSNVIHEKFVLANNVLTYERNDVETLVDGILWLNKKNL